ncbi:hypothetical protein F5984_12980 [Rudanella paleaurantiibacter]|uniref:Uncharacterized protein n=1 Tax=Rudanella paleaurantiibacter TaxID=2614655 RepID=A0A7J5U0H1_9BACT|nr:hypothetical protein [Rudanella paleaurantiibacter]KAB7730090.1 hypothetical protein F5984_12980 [Rudanella paleaurantiibacter]
MENINQDAMMNGRQTTSGPSTGGPLQIPDDRTMLGDEATENLTRMVNEGADDSADDSPSLHTPDPQTGAGPQTGADSPTGMTNPEDSPLSR